MSINVVIDFERNEQITGADVIILYEIKTSQKETKSVANTHII